MTGFMIVGAVGLVLILASLIFDDVFEGMFDVLDVDAGSGLFSAPVIGAFLTASGWGGALVLWGSGASLAVASVAGVGSGVVLGYLAWWLTRAFMRMPTDETPRIGDLLGKEATVITRIPDSGYGEIRVRHLGQMMKLNARATEPITAGAAVVITQVLSASSVLVEPEATFFGTLSQEQEQ